MKVLFGFPGWGWKMYGLASFRSGRMWFVGFSKQLPKVGGGDTAENLSKCPHCGGPADNGHDRCSPPSAYMCSKCCAEEDAAKAAPEGHNAELRGRPLADGPA